MFAVEKQGLLQNHDHFFAQRNRRLFVIPVHDQLLILLLTKPEEPRLNAIPVGTGLFCHGLGDDKRILFLFFSDQAASQIYHSPFAVIVKNTHAAQEIEKQKDNPAKKQQCTDRNGKDFYGGRLKKSFFLVCFPT